MGAYTDLTDFLNSLSAPSQLSNRFEANLSVVAARPCSAWTAPVLSPGVAPTTAAVPTSALAGAIPFNNGNGGQLYLSSVDLSGLQSGTYMLVDRLSHQGGLSAITTGVQTTNLPTAALTRYTSGVGVMATIMIYGLIGTTATTVTCSYTNQAGTPGQITPSVVIGSSGFREVTRTLFLPLVAGDTGVRSVENVNVVASTTTAGNFGVTLIKPLAMVYVDVDGQVTTANVLSGGMTGGIPEIQDNACLHWIRISTTLQAQSPCNYTLSMTER